MEYKGYLIDLDGTMYRGEEIIDGAKQFIDFLYTNNIPYVFITNNSTYTMDMIVSKLNRLGLKSTEDNVLTSAMATAKYIKNKNSEAHCYVVGEIGLIEEIENEDLVITDENCEYVIVGLDRKISYDKLAKASLFIQDGAEFIVTNKDAAIPTELGLLPGNGAIASAIAVSTGVEPLTIGKPAPIIMEEARKKMGLNKESVLMIGDNYDTDMKAGLNAGIDTLLVLTGYSTIDDLKLVEEQPTYVMADLIEWMHEKKLKSN